MKLLRTRIITLTIVLAMVLSFAVPVCVRVNIDTKEVLAQADNFEYEVVNGYVVTEEQMLFADYTNHGKVNPRDIAAIQKMMLS